MDKPNCGNCPHFKRWNNAGDAVGCCLSQKPYLTLLDVSYSVIQLKGCLSHPDARAYLMAPVLKELEHRKQRFPNEYLSYDTAIALIKGVK